MKGNIVEVAHRPNYESVKEYKDYTKTDAPNIQLGREIRDPDIECTCCTQKAPAEAAAMLKVQDNTPYGVQIQGEAGETVWICADCFHSGVRPKEVYFGDIKWNKQGRRIKQRAEKRTGHPW